LSRQDESRAFSICVLDSDPSVAAVYSDIFSSSRARLMVFSEPQAALEYIEEERLDLIIGSLQLSDEFLLELVDKARKRQPEGALLIMHPGLGAEDIAVLRGCGVQAVAPEDQSPLAYKAAIVGSINRFFGGDWGSKGSSNGRHAPADSLLNGALDLEVSDIIDKAGRLIQLPDSSDESLIQDAQRMAEAVGKVDSRRGLSFFEGEVLRVGKSRAALALLYLCEKAETPEQTWLLIRFLSFIPSLTTKLALQRLSKTHPNPKARDLAKMSCQALLRKFPIIFHAERLLSESTGHSVVSKAAESIAKCDNELAVGVLTSALAVRRPTVQRAAIRGLGMVGTESALKVIYSRLRVFRLIRETAFFQDSCDVKQHLLYIEALAAILRTTNTEHPEAAQEVAQELRSGDKRTKLKAIEIVGLSRASSCEMLSGLIRSPDWRIRMSVLQAVSHSPTPGALDVIRGFMDDPNRTISNQAMEILERLRMKDEIRKALQGGEDRVKAPAAAALGRLTDQESVSELVRLAFGDDRDAAHEALKSLGKIADPSCVPNIEKLLSRSARPEIVADAAYCLGKIASDGSLEVLIRQAKPLIRCPDFRLPLIIRAIGATINSDRWKQNDALTEKVLQLFQEAGITSDDVTRLEIAGVLLHIRGLSIRSYDNMLLLLERFAVRRSEATPQQSRMIAISREAIEHLRKKKLRLQEFERTLDGIRQILESLPARPDGGRYRMFAALGDLLSSVPLALRRKNAVAEAAVDALLKCLNNPQASWKDRASAIKSLSMIGERRALHTLRELKRGQEPHSTELAIRAIRSIIKKNLRGSGSQETAPQAQEEQPAHFVGAGQAPPYVHSQIRKRVQQAAPLHHAGGSTNPFVV